MRTLEERIQIAKDLLCTAFDEYVLHSQAGDLGKAAQYWAEVFQHRDELVALAKEQQ